MCLTLAFHIQSDRNSFMIFFFNANFLSRNKEPSSKNCGFFFSFREKLRTEKFNFLILIFGCYVLSFAYKNRLFTFSSCIIFK